MEHRGCTCEAQKAAGGDRFQDGVLVEIDFEPCLSAVQNNFKNPPWRQNVCSYLVLPLLSLMKAVRFSVKQSFN